jgi:hypothetical protein
MVWLFVSSSVEKRITDVMVPSGFYSFHPGLYFPAKENKKKELICWLTLSEVCFYC